MENTNKKKFVKGAIFGFFVPIVIFTCAIFFRFLGIVGYENYFAVIFLSPVLFLVDLYKDFFGFGCGIIPGSILYPDTFGCPDIVYFLALFVISFVYSLVGGFISLIYSKIINFKDKKSSL